MPSLEIDSAQAQPRQSSDTHDSHGLEAMEGESLSELR